MRTLQSSKKTILLTEGRYEINQVKKYCDLLHLLDCEQELIRKSKALDVAVDALKGIKDGKIPVSLGIYMDINDALEQINALEQKD